MKNTVIIPVIILSVFLTSLSKEKPVRIFMAGDSTMALKPLYKTVFDPLQKDSVTDEFPERGWGQLLPIFFSENIIIENYAQNGRSSRTFIEQGWWTKIMDNLSEGDYVVIQFGHNDSAADRPDRYTPPDVYITNLIRFITDVRSKGANPIICTPIVRRRFDKQGNFQDSHGEYVELARKTAAEKQVPLIDMYNKSKKLISELGKDESVSLFLHIPAGVNKIFPNGNTDNTHFTEKGAKEMASLFINGLWEQKIEHLTKELK